MEQPRRGVMPDIGIDPGLRIRRLWERPRISAVRAGIARHGLQLWGMGAPALWRRSGEPVSAWTGEGGQTVRCRPARVRSFPQRGHSTLGSSCLKTGSSVRRDRGGPHRWPGVEDPRYQRSLPNRFRCDLPYACTRALLTPGSRLAEGGRRNWHRHLRAGRGWATATSPTSLLTPASAGSPSIACRSGRRTCRSRAPTARSRSAS